MNDIVIATLMGCAAGIVDVVPMIIKKLDKTSCISAFLHFVVLGLIIPFVEWDIQPIAKGSIIAIIFAIPVMIITYPKDKKAIIPMVVSSIVLGGSIGYCGSILIG